MAFVDHMLSCHHKLPDGDCHLPLSLRNPQPLPSARPAAPAASACQAPVSATSGSQTFPLNRGWDRWRLPSESRYFQERLYLVTPVGCKSGAPTRVSPDRPGRNGTQRYRGRASPSLSHVTATDVLAAQRPRAGSLPLEGQTEKSWYHKIFRSYTIGKSS